MSAHAVAAWIDPVVRWEQGMGCAAHYAWLLRNGVLLARWPAAPFEVSHTDCFALDDDYWIWQPGIGGIRFRGERPEVTAYSTRSVDDGWFTYLVSRSWLPPVYQVWGRQVLHASAVVHEATGHVVAFAGPSGAGKSTVAYGLSQRAGWRQVCDDTLAFSCGGDDGRDADVTLHHLENDARLRPPTAAYFGMSGRPHERVRWPSQHLRWHRVYFLESTEAETLPDRPHRLTTLRPAETYRNLLEQAHAFTLAVPSHNQRLMRDYLAVAAAVPAYRLTYRRSFDVIEQIFDTVESHALAGAGEPPADNRAPLASLAR
jgi:hypothetical protein